MELMATAAEKSSPGLDLVALGLRPLVVFFGVTGTAHALVQARISDRFASADQLDRYDRWLLDLFPLRAELTDGLGASLQMALAGLLVGTGLGLFLGSLMRLRWLRRPLTRLGLPVVSLAGPVLGLIGLYWLVVRFDVGLSVGYVSLTDDWGRGINRLILPAAMIGITMAPSLATMVARGSSSAEPYRLSPAAAPLASRAVPRERWRLGFPAGLMVSGLLLAELLFSRPGVFAMVLQSLQQGEADRALDSLAVIVLAGAGLALLVDVVGLLVQPARGPAQVDTRPPSPRLMHLSVGFLALLVLTGAVGRAFGQPLVDTHSRLLGPLASGHLLGTDQLGRDLVALSGDALGGALMAALVPSLIALMIGYGLALFQHRFPRFGQLVPGVAVDGFWWPLPFLAIFGRLSFVDQSLGLLEPVVLVMIGLALTPTALRLHRREPLNVDRGSLIRLFGLWWLLAPMALMANVIASFAGFDVPGRPSLGQQLSSSVPTLTRSAWPAIVPSITLTLALIGLYGLGSSLLSLAWARSVSVVDTTPTIDTPRRRCRTRAPPSCR